MGENLKIESIARSTTAGKLVSGNVIAFVKLRQKGT
jgi:hypothetical protein